MAPGLIKKEKKGGERAKLEKLIVGEEVEVEVVEEVTDHTLGEVAMEVVMAGDAEEATIARRILWSLPPPKFLLKPQNRR